VIGGAPANYQSNPHYLKVFGNHQNTTSSHLNDGDSSLYLILGDWILVVCWKTIAKKNIKVVIGNEVCFGSEV
jgi:hypothetical protein